MISTLSIVSTIKLSDSEVSEILPSPIRFLDTPNIEDEPLLSGILQKEKADILITDRVLSGQILQTWSRARRRRVILLVRMPAVNSTCFVSKTDDAICVFFGKDARLSQALATAEAAFHDEVTLSDTLKLVNQTSRSAVPEQVTIVGAGIVGLITALQLSKDGYDVEVIDRGPDPRTHPHWTTLGCTNGGANVRMFSLTECDNYHDRDSNLGSDLHGYLRKPISEMGWLIGRPERYTAEDETWIQKSMAVPIWLAEQYNEDIFTLNHESLDLWRKLIAEEPHLFDGVKFLEPLLRVASTRSYNEKQVKRQIKVGSLLRELAPSEVSASYPSLNAGCDCGEIAGGIEVKGFTLNIHNFVEKLIAHLAENGVLFRWNAKATQIVRNNGVVAGVCVDGKVRSSDHYFLSAGAYGENLLGGTESEARVHGVLGAWLSIPNIEPKLTNAMKISREGHIACSGNIIPAQDANGNDLLVFGSGFGYVGQNPDNVDPQQLDALFDSMEDYLAHMFPAAYRMAKESGQLRDSRKYCIRPWTATSLGVFEVQPAENGLLVIASGHNTGGFSQSTSVARATIDAYQGRLHLMHSLYHPRRFDAFWLTDDTSRPTSPSRQAELRPHLSTTSA